MMWVTNDLNALGFLPGFLDERDPRSAREQLNANYTHGGGWQPFEGHVLDYKGAALLYPGDPPMQLKGMTMLRNEVILVFQHDWVVILQKDGSWECARMD